MNMVQELGTNYFAQRFGGSFFKGPDGNPGMILPRGWMDERTVPCNIFRGKVEKTETVNEPIASDFFVDMGILAVPRLGWRSAAKGKYLAYLSRNNTSYQRGICTANLKRSLAPHTEYLINYGEISSSYYLGEAITAKLLFEQEYLTLADGIEQMNNGKLLAFPVTPALAVVPKDDTHFALLMGRREVGVVDRETKVITMSIPFDPSLLENV